MTHHPIGRTAATCNPELVKFIIQVLKLILEDHGHEDLTMDVFAVSEGALVDEVLEGDLVVVVVYETF